MKACFTEGTLHVIDKACDGSSEVGIGHRILGARQDFDECSQFAAEGDVGESDLKEDCADPLFMKRIQVSVQEAHCGEGEALIEQPFCF